ncbi:hypothetical protein GGH19_004538 [Coemansia sp. RSA 1807]|nr:hypothetical protein GGH97_004955 [Coemansia sp. RSA 475]KAJ2573328.1 hypothetical protein GGH19_004538 [Coemansia sp. RSA 1807]
MSASGQPPHTPVTPRALGARNASMGTLSPWRTGVENVEAISAEAIGGANIGTVGGVSMAVPSQSPDAHRRMLQRAHSQPAIIPDYHFSPRRKRVADMANSPRRIRRRLFFADGDAGPTRDPAQRLAAAAAIIREAVESGDAHVDLSDLDLDEVPDEIAELKHLVVLAPSGALVTDVQVTLGSNSLRGFPLAICELDNLTTLILSHNRITHVPPEIGNLCNLRELSVAHNKVRVLPIELTKLRRLHTLSVFPNPFMTSKETQGDKWPHVVELRNNGVPRLADLAARKLTRLQLMAVKQRLVQCVNTRAPGRSIGVAMEPDGSVVSALRAQHVGLNGHLCVCGRWFLAPPVELTVWAPLSILARPAPFRVRLCARSCLHDPALAGILAKPLHPQV